MKVLTKKFVTLESHERDILRDAIEVLESLSDEGVEQDWLLNIVNSLDDIICRAEWEVEQDD